MEAARTINRHQVLIPMICRVATCLVLGFASFALAAPPYPPVVAAWANGPLETRLAFSAPLGEPLVKALVGQTITFDGGNQTKGTLHIAGARSADGGRTLILATDPHPRDTTYTLPLGSQAVTYSLQGALATWTGDDQSSWQGWWPSLDVEGLRKLAKSSTEHARMLSSLSKSGQVRFLGVLRLPSGNHALKIKTSEMIDATIGDAEAVPGDDGSLNFALESTGEPIDLDVTISTTDGKPFALLATLQDARGAAADLSSSLRLPWTPIAPFAPAASGQVPDFSGGDPVKGEQVYKSETAKCASCHKINGKGGDVGPDLTDQADRDLAAIYRDVNDPSAVIHPDYVQYTVATKAGQVLAGIVRAEGPDSIKVTDANAKATIVPRSEIDDLRPGSASLMPVGLVGAIGEEKVKDLISYLKTGGKPAVK
jgi:putative heme-binding domain-containing protein